METRFDGDIERVRSWASSLEESTMQQALLASRSDAVAGPIALMPDAHIGRGATVGSVIPTENAIIPAAVGVDIGCGMIAVETKLSAGDLPDNLDGVLAGIEQKVPAGFNRHNSVGSLASKWLGANKLNTTVDLTHKNVAAMGQQLGTLGGGNHFVEVCLDSGDSVWIVLHSGSRGIGNILAQAHIAGAKELCKNLERSLEDKDLAYFLDSDDGFVAYINDMLWAQNYALANREIMMDAVIAALADALNIGVAKVGELRRINCHHNYCERETHEGREVWVTRKGAIRAEEGDWGVIPGSMGTSSFIVTGRANPDSYNSASHGAGRRFSRSAAKKRFTTKEFAAAMEGRTWQRRSAKSLLDEAPMAYKKIETVMKDQKDLVRIERELNAIVNFKGV